MESGHDAEEHFGFLPWRMAFLSFGLRKIPFGLLGIEYHWHGRVLQPVELCTGRETLLDEQ